MQDEFVSKRQAAKLCGNVHVSTLDRWVKRGTMPQPVRLSRKTVGWMRSTLQQVLAGGARA